MLPPKALWDPDQLPVEQRWVREGMGSLIECIVTTGSYEVSISTIIDEPGCVEIT